MVDLPRNMRGKAQAMVKHDATGKGFESNDL